MSNRHRCCVSLLHKNIWIQLEKGGSQRILQKWAGPKLTGVSGDTLSVRSCARVSLHLDWKRFDVTFVVVDGILVDAILGLDFLEANGGGGGYHCLWKKAPYPPPEGLSHSLGITSSQNCAGSIQLTVGSVITIPALSEMEIMVTPKGTVSGGTWMGGR